MPHVSAFQERLPSCVLYDIRPELGDTGSGLPAPISR
jgi:hypothetical protein